jgi:hypothetical protein
MNYVALLDYRRFFAIVKHSFLGELRADDFVSAVPFFPGNKGDLRCPTCAPLQPCLFRRPSGAMSDFDPKRFPLTLTSQGTSEVTEREPPTPGKSTLTGGSMPRTTRDLPSHPQPKSVFRTPEDEDPVDWTWFVKVTAPPSPFMVLPLQPPFACPMPRNSVREGEPMHRQQGEPPVLIPDTKFQWRQKCWETYAGAAAGVENMLGAVAPDLQRFQHPDQDPDLMSLGFVLPPSYQGGNLDALAGSQHVPNRGGPSLDSLFTGNAVNVNRDAVTKVSSSGVADAGFLGMIGADAALRSALHNLSSQASKVMASNHALKAAQARIAAAAAAQDVAAAEAEIEQLKRESEHVTGAIEFIDTGPAKVAELVKQGLETVTHVGAVCSLVLRTFPRAGLESAERRLAGSRFAMQHAQTEALESELAAAKEQSLAALHALHAAHESLAVAMTARRQAYDEAARQVIAASDGDQKLGAVIGAIPIAEAVVANLRHLTEITRDARPPCTYEGAIGLGIAISHGYSCALLLPQAIGWLEFIHIHFGFLCGDWSARLQSLQAIRGELAGHRPEGV